VFSVEKKDVDAEAHPEGVNPVGWAYEEAVAGRERAATHEAHETRECCIRNSNPVPEEGLASRIGDAQELSYSWTHGAWRLNLALAALNENEKHHDEQNSCNNANNCWCIHAFSYLGR
jgi:hypothetical protein